MLYFLSTVRTICMELHVIRVYVLTCKSCHIFLLNDGIFESFFLSSKSYDFLFFLFFTREKLERLNNPDTNIEYVEVDDYKYVQHVAVRALLVEQICISLFAVFLLLRIFRNLLGFFIRID